MRFLTAALLLPLSLFVAVSCTPPKPVAVSAPAHHHPATQPVAHHATTQPAVAHSALALKVTLETPEGWMPGGYGNLKFTLANKGHQPAKVVKWSGQWQIAGKGPEGDRWTEDFHPLVVQPGKEGVATATGYSPEKIVELSSKIPPSIAGTVTVEVNTHAIDLPFTVKVPASKLPEKTRLVSGKKMGLELMESRFKGLKRLADVQDYLDRAYLAMQELTGYTPFEGKLLVLKEVPRHHAFAYAGNPVSLNTAFVGQDIKEFDDGHICFGWLHETGHDFDFGDWYNWSGPMAEFNANLKLCYVIETVKANDMDIKRFDKNPAIKETYVDGRRFDDLFFGHTSDAYLADKTIRWQDMKSDDMHTLFHGLVRESGWDIVRGYYHSYHAMAAAGLKCPESLEDKVRLVAAVLSNQVGRDLSPLFQKYRLPVTSDDIQRLTKEYRVKELCAVKPAAKSPDAVTAKAAK